MIKVNYFQHPISKPIQCFILPFFAFNALEPELQKTEVAFTGYNGLETSINTSAGARIPVPMKWGGLRIVS